MSGGVCRQQGDYAAAIINVWTSFSSSSFRYREARASQNARYTHTTCTHSHTHTLTRRRGLCARPLNSEGSLAHLCKLDKRGREEGKKEWENKQPYVRSMSNNIWSFSSAALFFFFSDPYPPPPVRCTPSTATTQFTHE